MTRGTVTAGARGSRLQTASAAAPPHETDLEVTPEPTMEEVLALANAPLPALDEEETFDVETSAARGVYLANDGPGFEPPLPRPADPVPESEPSWVTDVEEALKTLADDEAVSPNNREALGEALEALGAAHGRTMEAVGSLFASAAYGGSQARSGDALALATLGVLDSFAKRPQPAPTPPPDVHVHVPQHDLSVHVDAPVIEPPHVEVHVPEQPPQPAPVVNVTLPEQPAPQVNVATPEVVVNLPEQAAPHVDVHVSAPTPRPIRVETDEDGNRRYVPEEPAAA